MVASLSFITLTLSALSLVSARPIPRQTQPEGVLEPHDIYIERYIQLQCSKQHSTPFFDLCCHPMLATENLKDRDPSCDPANASTSSLLSSTSTTTTAEATQTAVSNLGDNGDDHQESQAPPISSTAEVTSSATEQQTTSTTEQQAPPTSTDTPPPQPTQSQGDQGNNGDNNGGGDVVSGGHATWFLQNGVAGACGNVHSDDDLVAAIDYRRYGDLGQQSGLCGKQVLIKNVGNGQSVTVTIADACPTCDNSNSIDLSKGAFEKLADLGEGLLQIDWSFV